MSERRLPASDLVGSAEIAERLGLAHPESLHNLRRRHPEFPEPFARLGHVMIWSWTDVRPGREQPGGCPEVAGTARVES